MIRCAPSLAPARPLACACLLAVAASAAVAQAHAPSSTASAPEAAASEPSGKPPVHVPELVVEAPKPLKALLEANLDIERAANLAEAESLDDSEWARLIAATPAQAKALAETEGYFRAEVDVAQDPGNPQRLIIRLTPGPLATVGRL